MSDSARPKGLGGISASDPAHPCWGTRVYNWDVAPLGSQLGRRTRGVATGTSQLEAGEGVQGGLSFVLSIFRFIYPSLV